MKRSIDDLPIEILIEIIGNLSSYVGDYLSLRLVSSKWNYLIHRYFATIKHLVQINIEKEENYLFSLLLEYENSRSLLCDSVCYFVTKDGLIVCNPSNALDQIISCMELFPNLKAVSVDFSKYNEKDQDTLFNYLNTRPNIKSLELVCNDDTELQNDVKLTNIRNLALNAGKILSEDAISKLFQPDHKLTQLYVNTYVHSDLPFEDGISILKRMPTLRRFSQQIELVNHGWDTENGKDLLIYTKQPELSFENLEFYSFHAEREDFLNYVDNFVACCPNLNNIDCVLSNENTSWICELNNLRAYTNVENLAIQGYDSSWKLILKVLEMFPMVKNLKLKDLRGIGHNQISQALLKLPNLSLLYLRRLDEFSEYHCYYKDIVQVNCKALEKEYNDKYGRKLQIVRRNGDFDYEIVSFRHGFNFMQNIFWPDWPPKLLTD